MAQGYRDFFDLGTRAVHEEEVLLSNRFQDYAADLFIVLTQLNHSRKVVFGKQRFTAHDLTCQYNNDIEIPDACAASTALPIIFFSPRHPGRRRKKRPTTLMEKIGIPSPTYVAVDSGADLVVASYTHQPYHGVSGLSLSHLRKGPPAIAIQSIYLLIEQKIKNHIHNKQSQRNAIQTVSQRLQNTRNLRPPSS